MCVGIPCNNWGGKCTTAVHVSLMGAVQKGLLVSTLLPWGIAKLIAPSFLSWISQHSSQHLGNYRHPWNSMTI